MQTDVIECSTSAATQVDPVQMHPVKFQAGSSISQLSEMTTQTETNLLCDKNSENFERHFAKTLKDKCIQTMPHFLFMKEKGENTCHIPLIDSSFATNIPENLK